MLHQVKTRIVRAKAILRLSPSEVHQFSNEKGFLHIILDDSDPESLDLGQISDVLWINVAVLG